MRITFSKKIYNDDVPAKLMKKVEAIPQSKKDKRLPLPVYLVTLPVLPIVGDGMLEVYSANEFYQDIYQKMEADIHVVGAALDKGDALGLVEQMVNDVYQATGAFDMEAYFKET